MLTCQNQKLENALKYLLIQVRSLKMLSDIFLSLSKAGRFPQIFTCPNLKLEDAMEYLLVNNWSWKTNVHTWSRKFPSNVYLLKSKAGRCPQIFTCQNDALKYLLVQLWIWMMLSKKSAYQNLKLEDTLKFYLPNLKLKNALKYLLV